MVQVGVAGSRGLFEVLQERNFEMDQVLGTQLGGQGPGRPRTGGW